MDTGMENQTGRPSWDEYFMEVCRAIAKRATCDRGKSGCVIAKENQILATGYVGSPSGLPHCDEAGHELKKVLHDDGSVSMHCVRTVHAEQNAICQAARRGVAIDGATVVQNLRDDAHKLRHKAYRMRKKVPCRRRKRAIV